MSNVPFYVPKLKDKGVWLDYRGTFKGGYGWRHNISLKGIKYVAAHHSVTNPTKNAKKDVQNLFNIHVGGNKWGGIGYNFVITSEEKNGFAKVAYVGDLGNARAHTPNTKGAHGISKGYGNNHIIGICFIGSFHTGKLPTKAQLRSAHYLFEELIFKERSRLPAIKAAWSSVKGHLEFDATACPSNQLSKLKTLIKDTVEEVPKPAPKPAPAPAPKPEPKPAPLPPPEPEITQPLPVTPDVRPPEVEKDHQGADMKGVNDKLSGIEALLKLIWEALKSLLSIFNLKKGE